MKIVHLSDLHLGKKIKNFSLIEDQKHILSEILGVVENERADAVIVAGDIYDRQLPPVEAIELFDDFLTSLAVKKIPVLVISGNHDSAERVAFGSKLMAASNVYFSPAYNGNVEPVVINDEFGPVNFWLLPFIKPGNVRCFYPDEKIDSYSDAVAVAINHMNIDKSQRNVLVAHQFVTGASVCDSEEPSSVGGLDNVDPSVFDDFDYVALGHIHGPQKIGDDRIYYSGTPLKYSLSEKNHKKAVRVFSLFEKGSVGASESAAGTSGAVESAGYARAEYKSVELHPLRDMREISGFYNDIMLRDNYINTNTDDYVHIVLKDEEEIMNCFSKLQSVYPNLMSIEYDNIRNSGVNIVDGVSESVSLSPLELFEEFYELQNNKKLDDDQRDYMSKLIEEVWEENK